MANMKLWVTYKWDLVSSVFENVNGGIGARSICQRHYSVVTLGPLKWACK